MYSQSKFSVGDIIIVNQFRLERQPVGELEEEIMSLTNVIAEVIDHRPYYIRLGFTHYETYVKWSVPQPFWEDLELIHTNG